MRRWILWYWIEACHSCTFASTSDQFFAAIDAKRRDVCLSASFELESTFTIRDGNSTRIQGSGAKLWAHPGVRLFSVVNGSLTLEKLVVADTDCGDCDNTIGSVLFVDVGSTAQISSCSFERNRGYNGIVGMSGGIVTVKGSNFTSNSADSLGGVFFNSNGGILSLTRCFFVSNSAAVSGGILAATQNAMTDVTGCFFARNIAGQRGGVFDASAGATVTIDDSKFDKNSCVNVSRFIAKKLHTTQEGGVLAVESSSKVSTVRNSDFTGNSAQVRASLIL